MFMKCAVLVALGGYVRLDAVQGCTVSPAMHMRMHMAVYGQCQA